MDTDNSYRLIFTKRFLRELEKVDNYLSKNLFSKNVSNYLMNKIDDTLIQISIFPKSHELIENTKYRKALVKKYIILYIVNEKKKAVYIVHIFHSKSDYQRRLYSKMF